MRGIVLLSVLNMNVAHDNLRKGSRRSLFYVVVIDAKRITSFEMKCYRKILRISWMEKVTNKEVLSKLDMKTTMLLQKAKALKLKYFGHIKRHETLERHILEARIDGRRGRGRPTRRWEQDINDWMDMKTTQGGRLAEDRILFRQKVQEATSRQEIS